ncbi:MAG: type II secretion system major pseudopilin GspG [Halobacteriovoraceae bacterium]|nr:type II secretion system major pseudopilin GspG [Halobacteriovoraceae bacterium]
MIKNQNGFSLIEILIALTLMALAGTFVAGKFFQSLHEGRVKAANIQMQSLEGRLKEFRRHCNFYPSTEQGLEALVSKPASGRDCRNYAQGGYVDGDEIPLDPWDNDYIYESEGSRFTLYSYGADGSDGGEGEDADIYHRGKKKTAEEDQENI